MSEENISVEEPVTSVDESVVSAEKAKAPEPAPQETAPNKPLEFDENSIPPRRFFASRKEDMNFLRDKWILSRINSEDLMEYLKLEQKRNEQLQEIRELREKRIMSAFTLTASLVAAVTAIYFLKDNPTVLVNILYICALLVAFWIWKNPPKNKI